MDTSPEYIKMNLEAPELRKNWWPHIGDIIWRGEKYLMIPDACVIINNLDFVLEDQIPIFRQDQLQNMVREKYKIKGDGTNYSNDSTNRDLIELVAGFRNFVWNTPVKDLPNGSMEQLWMAFVMKEKYSKTWNGDLWID